MCKPLQIMNTLLGTCRHSVRAFSMIEVMVAVGVVGLCLGPLISMLSQSNRVSSASIYELMAVHYAGEIAEQLTELSPKLRSLVDYVRTLPGQSAATLATILNDATFNNKLEFSGNQIQAIPLEVNAQILKTSLLLSPLHDRFTTRSLDVEELDTGTNLLLKTGRYWKVGITLGWTLDVSEATDAHKAYFAVILHEKP